MVTKRPLDNLQEDVYHLLKQTSSSDEVQPRKRRFANVQAMTQYLSQKDSTTSDSTYSPTRAGYIKRINLINFMCHANFSLTLGPRLNFIVGNNGSGKSAILTAITIGLGAKATTTNRATSLKDLIKQGCNYSKITIILCNEGINCFQPEIYGKEIRIERTLKREGSTSAFSIRSENNREVSNKKKDLETIVDYFSIPVMNPMCFLSQDAARSFLTAASAQDKYLHFMRGTLLEETKVNLENAESTILSTRSRLNLLEENIKILQKDYKHVEHLLNELVSRNDWSSRRRLLQGKHMWTIYRQNQRKLGALVKRKNHLISKKQNYLERISDSENKIERYKVQKEESISEVTGALSSKQAAEAERSNLKIEIEKFKNEHSNLKNQQKIVSEELDSAKKTFCVTKSQLSLAEKELLNEMGGDKEQLRRDLDKINEKINKTKQLIRELQEKSATLDSQERDMAQNRRMVLEQISTSIKNMQAEFQEFQKSGDRLAYAFDKNMPMVRDTIAKYGNRFSSLPVGPVGYYVSIKSGYEKFAPLIQTHINATLGAFVVYTSKDAVLLREIFKKCNLKKVPLIITYKLHSFDYSRGKASYGLTISDVLTYDIPELEFLLVDQNRIEKTLLAGDKDEGDNILRNVRPRNVNLVLAFRDKNSGLNMSLSGGSGMRLNVVNYAHTLRLKIGNGSDMNYLRDAIETQKNELEQRRTEFNKQINQLRSDKRQVDLELGRNTKQLKEWTKEVDELEDKLVREVDSGRVDGLKSALDEQQKGIEQLQSNIASFEEKFAELGVQLTPVKARYDGVTKRYNDAQTLYSRALQVESTIEGKINQNIAHIDEVRKKIELNGINLGHCLDEIKVLETKCNDQHQRASTYCNEEELLNTDLPNSEESILREIREIDESVRVAEQQLGLTQSQISELYDSSKEKYETAVEKYNDLAGSLVKVHDSLVLRRSALELSVKGTCTDADIDFRTSIKTRPGYSGSLSFKQAGQLNVMVQTINDTSPRNVDTLSGGEKSFSQIALLLATWLTMRSRIIALDEFDVFMDQVNRKIGTDLIIRRLGKDVKGDTQTVIITPQDIGKMANIDEKYVHVHKIKDPERQNNSNFYV